MSLANVLTKHAFLDQLFGAGKGPDWTEQGPGLKVVPQRDVTYVQQKAPKPPLQREAEGGTDPMMQYMMLSQLMGGGHGPSITLGAGQQEDPLQKLLMMHLMGKGLGKTGALSADLAKMIGRSPEHYARNIMGQLTPEHYQAAGGAGGEDTIEELVNNIIPHQIISRHAMQLGGGNVDLGKAILDAHLAQNPMRSGENLQEVLKRMLQQNIQGTQDQAVQQALQGFGGEMPQLGHGGPGPLSRDDLMAIIEKSLPQMEEQVGPQAGIEQAPAMQPTGLSPQIGYPKTGRFADLRQTFNYLKQASTEKTAQGGIGQWFTPGRYVQMLRGGPKPEDVQRHGLSRFVDPSGEQFRFDPQSFRDVFMKDPSVQRMGRTLGPQATNMMELAAKPGVMGWLQRGFQKHIMGRGQQLGAAEQGLRNIAEATGLDTQGQPLTRRDMAQHFQTMTGTPAGRAGGEIGRQLMGASSPAPMGEGQASGLFGAPGLGKMNLGDPLTNMIHQMAMIRAMTSPQVLPRLGGY